MNAVSPTTTACEDVKAAVKAAIQNTLNVLPGYLEKTLEQRNPGPNAAGSVFLKSVSVEDLLNANWQKADFATVAPGCTAYVTPIPGHLGIESLSELDPQIEIVLDDRKDTGKISATVSGVLGEVVDFTTIIIGPEKGVMVVYTVHPGAPVHPSKVLAEKGLHGKKVTVAQARELGLETAKIVAG